MSDVLLDTNVLVYGYDRSEAAKQERAREVLAGLAAAATAAVTTQVLAEFFVSITRKVKPPVAVELALEELAAHLRLWTVLDMTAVIVMTAAEAARKHQMNFWDAQIWAAAKLNGIALVLSEDFSDGSRIEGVRFRNPFAPGFRLESPADF